jgi:hypothetical protein
MYKKVEIPTRSFYCELKHRPADDVDGSREELVETLIYKVPRLKNSTMEKQWCFHALWGRMFEEDYLSKGINQIFIFTAEFGELLIRMEANPYVDDECQKLPPPEGQKYDHWRDAVNKQFKKLYGISVSEWSSTF